MRFNSLFFLYQIIDSCKNHSRRFCSCWVEVACLCISHAANNIFVFQIVHHYRFPNRPSYRFFFHPSLSPTSFFFFSFSFTLRNRPPPCPPLLDSEPTSILTFLPTPNPLPCASVHHFAFGFPPPSSSSSSSLFLR